MKRTIIFLLVVLLFVSGCTLSGAPFGRGPSYADQNYFQGTQGLVISFLDQAPPRSVFEGSAFDVQLLVENKGAFDLVENHTARFTLTFDTAEIIKQGIDADDAIMPETTFANLYGKSPNYPEGDSMYIFNRDFNDYYTKRAIIFNAKQVQANFEQNTATVFATACYPYKTYFTDDVCVDKDPQGMDLRQKVCSARDYTYSNGQGAPVAITAVESNMVPRGSYILPQFVIHVEHKGRGIVSDFILNQQQCGEVTSDTVNTFQITARLGNDDLVCQPDIVRLRNGKAEIVCKLEENIIDMLGSNYNAPLQIELSYLYTETISKDITIQRTTPLNLHDDEIVDSDFCHPWELFIEESSGGTCVSACEYYARQKNTEFFRTIATNDSQNNPKAYDWPIIKQGVSSTELQDAWETLNCVYGTEADCRRNPSTCIIAQDLCLPGTFCGWPMCLENNQQPQARQFDKTDTSLAWYCVDGDDKGYDVQRTCGCAEIAYWTFVEKANFQLLVGEDKQPRCENLPDFKYEENPVEGDYDPLFKQVVFRTALPPYDSAETSICLKVVDKQGNAGYQRIN